MFPATISMKYRVWKYLIDIIISNNDMIIVIIVGADCRSSSCDVLIDETTSERNERVVCENTCILLSEFFTVCV